MGVVRAVPLTSTFFTRGDPYEKNAFQFPFANAALMKILKIAKIYSVMESVLYIQHSTPFNFIKLLFSSYLDTY